MNAKLVFNPYIQSTLAQRQGRQQSIRPLGDKTRTCLTFPFESKAL